MEKLELFETLAITPHYSEKLKTLISKQSFELQEVLIQQDSKSIRNTLGNFNIMAHGSSVAQL